MTLVSLGVLLMVIGLALVFLLEGFVGEMMIVAGVLLLLYKLIRVADSESMDRQAEIDARADDIRSQHQNPV